MTNLDYYNKFRSVPDEAQKLIGGGRLKGMTDINPMWRIKVLTEQFGMCGFGWKYDILEERLERGAEEEIAAFVRINLFVKVDDVWSEPIPGTGGSSFVTKESKGLYTSDECFKMALTDALSIACKSLGVGADIYFAKDRTKYDSQQTEEQQKQVSAEVKSPKPRIPKAAFTSTNLESLKIAGLSYTITKEEQAIIDKRIKELEDGSK